MNAHAWYEEQNNESPMSQPEPQDTTEAGRARTWLNTINLDAMEVNGQIKADFFKYTLGVFRGEKVFYLFTKSPQQKIYRHTMPTTRARGNMDDLKTGLELL